MAPGTSTLGWLAATAVCVALVVVGCGGGSSSSVSATTGSTDSQATTNKAAEEGAGNGSSGATEEGGNQTEQGGGGNSEKKTPPVEAPEGPPEKGATKEQEEKVPVAEIALSIPKGLTAGNTCKGKNASPELTWTGVPPGTEELAFFAVNVQPVKGKLYFDWAMAGVDPSLTRLKEGEVPDGAVLGRNGEGKEGWSLCPKKPGSESYIFTVYAIGKSLSPEEGFDPLTMRSKAGEVSEQIGFEGVEFGG
jgi:phosphatidylethanolamine-binding protein (PEBP) family uncharacterized protein